MCNEKRIFYMMVMVTMILRFSGLGNIQAGATLLFGMNTVL